MGETTNLQRVVEEARLWMTIDEKPENVPTPVEINNKSGDSIS